MRLLAITQHPNFVERLRTAFEPEGHGVFALPDPLYALAEEAWTRADLVVVDAQGDPMDGYRLCHLLRAQARFMFRKLPVVLLLDHPPEAEDQARLAEVDGDAFLSTEALPGQCLTVLGSLAAAAAGPQDLPVPILACGLDASTLEAIREGVAPLGCEVSACAVEGLEEAAAAGNPPILFLGPPPDGRTREDILRELGALPDPPCVILIGDPGDEELPPLLEMEAMGWLEPPLSAAKVRLAVTRAMARQYASRVQRECRLQLSGLLAARSRLEQETEALRNEVLMDPLTELLNRRAFNQHLDHAVNQWVRHARPFVLILGDLDYFKLINDRFGHMVGDQVLKTVSLRIRASLRKSDLAFRIGGEEFAILLTETQLKAGLDVAEKIRRRIDETPVTLDSGQSVFPTMSFGIGGPDGHDAGALFSRVDTALYAAKHKGRNRVELTEKA